MSAVDKTDDDKSSEIDGLLLGCGVSIGKIDAEEDVNSIVDETIADELMSVEDAEIKTLAPDDSVSTSEVVDGDAGSAVRESAINELTSADDSEVNRLALDKGVSSDVVEVNEDAEMLVGEADVEELTYVEESDVKALALGEGVSTLELDAAGIDLIKSPKLEDRSDEVEPAWLD